jgi:cytoskeletal protein CcmA (bactofilin family)
MKANHKRHRPATQALVKEKPWTLVGPGSVIHGELLMAGNVLIHGRVEGIVFTDGEVWVTTEGAVDGGVHARRVVVEGSCEGRLEATEEVILKEGSIMRGDIEAGILTVDDGARFLGHWIRGEGDSGPKILTYKNSPGHA